MGNNLLNKIDTNKPPIVQAYEIQELAASVGFEWNNITEVLDKIKEEIEEFEEAYIENDKNKMIDELGDIIMAIVNLARWSNINPETALNKTIDKFKKRFAFIEQTLKNNNKDFADATLEEMDSIWNKAKKIV